MSKKPLSREEFLERMAKGRAKAAARAKSGGKGSAITAHDDSAFQVCERASKHAWAFCSTKSAAIATADRLRERTGLSFFVWSRGGKTEPNPPRRRAKSAAERSAAHVIVRMGQVRAIEYDHTDDGKAYRHDFKGKRPTLGHFRDGKHLAITPIRTVRRNGKTFIGD